MTGTDRDTLARARTPYGVMSRLSRGTQAGENGTQGRDTSSRDRTTLPPLGGQGVPSRGHRLGMREKMPRVAEAVERYRAEWGRAHVDECIRRGMAGEPSYFVACEGGHVVGTPFDGGDPVLQRMLELGCVLRNGFALAIRPPEVAR